MSPVAPALMDQPTSRRQAPCLVVPVTTGSDRLTALEWALREAARRQATVLAVALVDSGVTDRLRTAALASLDAVVLQAVGATGVHGRARTALMDPLVYQALAGTARGGDLVVVRPEGKTLLRPATPRLSGGRPSARTR